MSVVDENGQITSDDHIRCAMNTLKMKVQLLRELGDALGFGVPEQPKEVVDSVNKANASDKIKTITKSFIERFKSAFRVRSKTPIKNTRLSLTMLYISKMGSMCPDLIVRKHNNKRILKNKYTIAEWDIEKVTFYNTIIQFSRKRKYTDVSDIRVIKKDRSIPDDVITMNKIKAQKVNLFK